MHDSVCMAIGSGLKDLISEFLYCFWRQWSSYRPHVFLEIVFTVLEDQIEIILLINYLFELDYVWMFYSFQERDLADGCARHTVVFFFQFDLFESTDL